MVGKVSIDYEALEDCETWVEPLANVLYAVVIADALVKMKNWSKAISGLKWAKDHDLYNAREADVISLSEYESLDSQLEELIAVAEERDMEAWERLVKDVYADLETKVFTKFYICMVEKG